MPLPKLGTRRCGIYEKLPKRPAMSGIVSAIAKFSGIYCPPDALSSRFLSDISDSARQKCQKSHRGAHARDKLKGGKVWCWTIHGSPVLASTRATPTPFKRHGAALDDARSPRRRSFFTSPSYHRVTIRRDIPVDFEAVERNGAETDRKRKLWLEEQCVGDCKLSDGREL